jgi:ABC-type bacteriocin/lantibiotic exporter with double-glycine peptidase domain
VSVVRDSRRRFLVPEVLQTSLMDCGPAALKAVLEGFGIPADYDTLRERCQTDVDGTSIDALAALGREYGLRAARVLVARDSFLLPESNCLPAIVLTRSAGGLLHFDVVWRRVGPFVQVMDPCAGRRWVRSGVVLARMPDVPIPISMQRWRSWASTRNARAPLLARLARLGIGPATAGFWIDRAEEDATWRGLAALDAAVRMVQTLLDARAVRRGADAEALLCTLVAGAGAAIPRRFWWVEPAASGRDLTVRGALILHFAPSRAAPARSAAHSSVASPPGVSASSAAGECEDSIGPLHTLWRIVRRDSPRGIAMLVAALACSAATTAGEAVLFRGIWQIGSQLSLTYQRAAALVGLLAFTLIALLLEALIHAAMRRLGLRLETRLRAALLEKIPRLGDAYLRSRTTWDLASRAHALHLLRDVPALGTQLARAVFAGVTIGIGIVWLHPGGAVPLVCAALLATAIAWITRGRLLEAVVRLRNQTAGLDRLYLDALLGATAVRAHGGESAVQSEHEDLLVDWFRTSRSLSVQSTLWQTLHLVSITGMTVALVIGYLRSGLEPSGLLLLVYWSVRLGFLSQEVVSALSAMRNLRTVAVRLLAPLSAKAADAAAPHGAEPLRPGPARGVAIRLDDVRVEAGGRTILDGVSAEIAPGSHVAIVGASGAGKSSLLGLLLGWLQPARGRITIDGEPLDGPRLRRLRSETAWIDPSVALWDRSLIDNVAFGAAADQLEHLPRAMERADVLELIDELPQGARSGVGEGGAWLSGGQGQRVRMARAWLRPSARLVLLDEAFRGLQRSRRTELLARTREQWAGATLLFVTHDVSDTEGFDRVLVLDAGRIVEDDRAERLRARPESLYRALARADERLRPDLWWAPDWRRARIEDGRLVGAEAR